MQYYTDVLLYAEELYSSNMCARTKARVPSHGPNTSKQLQHYKINRVRSGVFKTRTAKKLLPRPRELVVGNFWVVMGLHTEQNYYFFLF